jgi:hypothetical protein
LTQRLSPTLFTVLDDDICLALKELGYFGELTDGLTLNTEADTSTTEQDEHSLIEGLKVIYG